MKLGKPTLAAATLVLMLTGNGCDVFHRKKATPPPSIPPNLEHQKIDLPQPQPTPPATPEPAPPAPPTQEPPKQKPRHSTHTPPKKVVVPPPEEETAPEPAKPSPDASINAPMTSAQAEQQRQQTTGLLDSAESNLSNIRRSLSSDEQQMVAQIRNYISQSRKAMSDGDLERAHNLANKANLLSGELVKE